MERLVQEVRAALNGDAYTLALMGSLAMIDVCAALDSENGETDRTKFKAWFEQHFPMYTTLSSADVYKMRCGVLHQGRASTTAYKAVVFTLPAPVGTLHNNVFNDALNLDLVIFCSDIVDTVERWWNANRDEEHVARNAEHILQMRPQGLPPYIVGTPVLA